MIEDRFVITDGLWRRLEPCLPGKVSDSGVTAKNNRLFLEAVLWRVRTGLPWRAFQQALATGTLSFVIFADGQKGGVFEILFKAVSNDLDLEYALMDGIIVQAHQKAAGAKGGFKITPLGARAAA